MRGSGFLIDKNMRLDKYLCDLNIASRKDLKKIIKTGAVTVNGNKISDPSFHINESKDEVVYNGNKLSYEKFVYFMLNKPNGLVSATEDNISKTVIDLFNNESQSDLFPVGRLDKDTTGLLLITNDGELGHRLTSPAHHVPKTYEVTIEHSLSIDDIKALENGVELTGDGITKPASVDIISDTTIHLTITEGKFHQVKRMLAAVNNKVIKLKRLSMGSVFLDENLKEGEYRRLTDKELELLKQGK